MTSAWRYVITIVAVLSAVGIAQETASLEAALEAAAALDAPKAPAPADAPATAAEPSDPADTKASQSSDARRSTRGGRSSATPTAAPSLPERGRDLKWDEYRIVVDRNIFSRQRSTGQSGPGGSSENGETQAARVEAPPGPPPDPATQVVLIGVSFVGDYATAIFEDRNAGSIIAVQIGETLMDRVAKEITLDAVTFDYKGEALDVPIGRTLLGGEPAAAPEGSATTPTGAGASTSTTPVSADQKAILERLRQRREQELK